ncbi:MAG: signal recognition particle-docking protein FtsY [Armatimonadota bacterium]|nr:signal recognition particle-docking protein FtsY [Armatimonadota bacterium]MDR7436756.1 signal recognition particle-docking protein FtsY [Armatimonadota bacterium]MDR7472703.1 signal recognition particle-docking protein FtsY [Armatimonadota bacterium]MDR7507006.1 signal recognition particle-docking protein FtsY [Armatimonadota bacterium]MDR7508867.1 signal recognition particle-docking protein FtsY [Armatimonadota bacterium]
MGWADRLRAGLTRTRDALLSRVLPALARPGTEFLEELEAALLQADVGVAATSRIVAELARHPAAGEAQRLDVLRAILLDMLGPPAPLALDPPPAAILILGVNGSGKTATAGKLAARLGQEGRRVILAAADTFRAAAIEQLEIWAARAGADLVRHAPGGDPAAVVYDALAAARARRMDVVIADTAGRLHTRTPLMAELAKIARVVDRALPSGPVERLLVLDATTGQNALAQARAFHEAVRLTGVVLAKVDVSPRAGAALAVASELGLPIKLVGVGEGLADLGPFDPAAYVDALLPPPAGRG